MDYDADYKHLYNQAIAVPESHTEAKSISQECLSKVSSRFNIPAVVLKTFLKTEGGYPGHIRKNTNESWDVGPMQINSIHRPSIYEKFGISPMEIRFDGCINLMTGAWLIRNHFDKYKPEQIDGWNTMFKVFANYHSKTEKVNADYSSRWVENLNTILEEKK